MEKPTIGFVGLGIMGAPMARHLAQAGYMLTVYDNQPAAVERAMADLPDVAAADSPAQVAERSQIVVTMLPNGRVVRKVALDEGGLVEGFRSGSLLLDTSSSEPWITMETARTLDKHGVSMVDAPVSGAQAGAQTATLVFMAGGDPDDLARVSPLLETMGENTFHLGPLGSGHTMKCLNNLVTAMTFMATAEVLTIGKQCSLDPAVMTDVLNVSTGGSWISETQFHQRIFSRKFDDAFKLKLMLKDIGIAMDLAQKQGIPMPLSSVGHHLWRASARHAEPDASISDMVRWVEQMTGVRLASDS